MELLWTCKKHDVIWVIVDRLTKSSHFLLIHAIIPLEKLAHLYIKKIVRLHGIPKAIVSDRDSCFTCRFWKSFQRTMGTRIKMSSSFHPQMDGQTERIVATIEDMLRVCILGWQGHWDEYLPLVEFAYNNSHYSSIRMVPFEALFGRPYCAPGYWSDITESKRTH